LVEQRHHGEDVASPGVAIHRGVGALSISRSIAEKVPTGFSLVVQYIKRG
jgi:hypothetical protein